MRGRSESELKVLVESHLSRNHELNKSIESQGVDLDAPRPIDLHFWASTEKAARNLAIALEAEGYSPVSTNLSARGPALWNVEAQVEASPVTIATPLFVERLIRLAADYDGEFDGWGTSI